jgi:hypothetical protein
MYKLIIKDHLIFIARPLDPKEADHLAKVNGLQFAELFTRKYNGKTLHVGPDGKVIRVLDIKDTPGVILEP